MSLHSNIFSYKKAPSHFTQGQGKTRSFGSSKYQANQKTPRSTGNLQIRVVLPKCKPTRPCPDSIPWRLPVSAVSWVSITTGVEEPRSPSRGTWHWPASHTGTSLATTTSPSFPVRPGWRAHSWGWTAVFCTSSPKKNRQGDSNLTQTRV